ncbi:kinetochore protein Mis18 [Hamiltosporidium tvaerminnensis]|uniref:Protein yippee-like n=2 Tax=Hamiltosporidium TaxID=1176354 RepID=A0A4Q9KRM4_9MICR|nr:kinetochore protein Mis18 [Hamiltosporidium magnivora]TBU10149.1 kinetochore protein Mis18 [Hamiltosporidium tvaerminnensis]
MIQQNPFVIQCKSCKTILGDSFTLLNYKNNTLIFSTLATTTNILPTNIVSNNTLDKDCTYNIIQCSLCNSFIGKKYIVVNFIYKEYLNRYCIEKDKIYSYQLGCEKPIDEIGVSELSEEISKLQKFCVYLFKKIK